MTPEDLKAAEQRGYSKGYQAGKRRKKKNIQREVIERQKHAFWQKAFLAILPTTLLLEGWTRGNVPIKTMQQRVLLAAETADEATRLGF